MKKFTAHLVVFLPWSEQKRLCSLEVSDDAVELSSARRNVKATSSEPLVSFKEGGLEFILRLADAEVRDTWQANAKPRSRRRLDPSFATLTIVDHWRKVKATFIILQARTTSGFDYACDSEDQMLQVRDIVPADDPPRQLDWKELAAGAAYDY